MEFTLLSIVFILLTIFVIAFGRPFFRGAPFAATDRRTEKNIMMLTGDLHGKRSCDIGSGDGRLVIAMAKNGANATGFEINPFLVLLSRMKALKTNCAESIVIKRTNFWKENFSNYDLITLFGIPYIMKGLEEKLQKELRPGARVFCNRYAFPTWQPDEKKYGLLMYTKK